MNAYLLDTNLIIYASKPDDLVVERFVDSRRVYVSAISTVEALGYHKLDPSEKARLEAFFRQATLLPIDMPVLQRAIDLRQQRRMSLGDSRSSP
ncbi:MAG: hypothetical protein QM770_03365 [Tepidisphaeraceae bacterium]